MIRHRSDRIVSADIPVRPVVRHHRIRASALPWPAIGLALMLALSKAAVAVESVHLLGFVAQMCPDEDHCFELLVKPEFIGRLGERIRVRFAGASAIYDPENYELTLQQQNIVPGSHLRMLVTADTGRGPGEYQASIIWIGD